MRKKLLMVLTLLCAVALTLGLTACKEQSVFDKTYEQGYRVFVTYSPVNGRFSTDSNMVIVDAFKPANYEAANDGKIYISLKEPDAKDRWGTLDMNLNFTNHSLVGWYKNAVMKTDESGNALGEDGERLYLSDGVYYSDAQLKNVAYPAYEYSEPWDFATDKVVYDPDKDDKLEITLYAGWIRYYNFEYYYKYDDGPSAEWTKYGETTFDYVYNNEKGGDKNLAYLPAWSDYNEVTGVSSGKMDHDAKYGDGTTYTFPKLSGATFKAAYTDEACTQKIDGAYLTHSGSLDKSTCSEVNRTVKVYVVFEKGEKFLIESAAQFSKYGKSTGKYVILSDLDFTGVTWPTAIESGTFAGTIEGNGKTVSNVTAKHSSSKSAYGGLFGAISSDASIKDISFKNILFDTQHLAIDRTVSRLWFGTFAGYIEDGAKFENVTVTNATFSLGAIALTNNTAKNANFNLFATDDRTEKTGLTLTDTAHLEIYAEKNNKGDVYYYTLAIELSEGELANKNSFVDSDGRKLNLTIGARKSYSSSEAKERYVIQ